jgi:hypothetical protein
MVISDPGAALSGALIATDVLSAKTVPAFAPRKATLTMVMHKQYRATRFRASGIAGPPF